jgi:decaprenylphospho-beta-D-erythro-pentofuranosid-2-ulose 2-reductase
MKDALGAVQSVLVLGGGSDIGVATAKALAGPRAARVVLAGRRPEELQKRAGEVEEAGASSVDVVAFDALDTASHQVFVDDVVARHGDLDVVVAAFGVLGDQQEAERDAGAALEVAATNYVGFVSVAIPISQRLRAQGHGTLVVLSTVAAERARRSNFVYGSSKAGVDAFAQGLGYALEGSGASVLLVRPGFVETKMTAGMDPMPLATTADGVADAIVDALARGREVIWVPPPLRLVMIALRHLPRSLFRRLKI